MILSGKTFGQKGNEKLGKLGGKECTVSKYQSECSASYAFVMINKRRLKTKPPVDVCLKKKHFLSNKTLHFFKNIAKEN